MPTANTDDLAGGVRPSCVTCGAQYAGPEPPRECKICADDRQYVPELGQRWTTQDGLRAAGHRIVLHDVEPAVVRVTAAPEVGIGQHGYLVKTPAGAVLWDAPAYVDEAVVPAMGEVIAVATSHPHFYGVMVDWGAAFDAPVLVAEADAEWVPRHDHRVELWRDQHQILPGVRLVQCGGHFPGSAVLHSEASGGRLFTGDTIAVVAHSGWVSFAYSFPNHIPLSASEVQGVGARVESLRFERLYGAFGEVANDAYHAVQSSVQRYVDHVTGNMGANE